MGNKKDAICCKTFCKLSWRVVVHFTTYIKLVLPQIRLLTVLNVAGKILNSAFQLVLQQCCKTSCTLLLPVLPKLMLLFFVVHKKPLREVEIAAICHDALQVIKKNRFFHVFKLENDRMPIFEATVVPSSTLQSSHILLTNVCHDYWYFWEWRLSCKYQNVNDSFFFCHVSKFNGSWRFWCV